MHRVQQLSALSAARPWQALLAYTVVASAGYWLASHAPYMEPIVIRRGPVEAAIAVAPWAVFPYASYALLLPVFILSARKLASFERVFVSALACGLLNIAGYLIVPTVLEVRPEAPANTLLATLQRLDPPFCALPSGHVALPVAIAIGAALAATTERAQREARRWRGLAMGFSTWALLLAASAVLTGQHYVVDVITGFALGALVASFGAALRRSQTIGRARQRLHRPTIRAFIVEWCAIGITLMIAIRWWSIAIAVVAGLIIATRQHALLVLYHDGVHGHVARSRRLNDFIVNLAAGLPMLLPVHVYRPLHFSHHRHLGSEADPERVLLYRGQPWAYRPLALTALARQLTGDLAGWRALVLAGRYLRERRGPALQLPRYSHYPELYVQAAVIIACAAAFALIAPGAALRATILWCIPYITLTQLLQKIRSFAEHATADAEPTLSCSWAPGVIGRLTIWPYNINYHREHHDHPDVPWSRLPESFPNAHQRLGRELRSHVWNGALR